MDDGLVLLFYECFYHHAGFAADAQVIYPVGKGADVQRLGKGIREFNDAKNNVRQEIEEGMKEKPVQPSATTDTPQAESK